MKRRQIVMLSAGVSVALMQVTSSAEAQSLYQEDSFRSLIGDNKAFRPGDVITVQVFENSTAVSSSDTATRRKNGISAELAHGPRSVGQTSISVGSDFDGGGRTQRTNRLLTTVTVTVRQVLENGQLRIAGEQLVTVNDEPQRVTVEGLVRPLDITDGNVVMSTRIADARITYVGEGDLASRGRKPWWRSVTDWIGF